MTHIAIALFEGAEELDWAGPWEVLAAWSQQRPVSPPGSTWRSTSLHVCTRSSGHGRCAATSSTTRSRPSDVTDSGALIRLGDVVKTFETPAGVFTALNGVSVTVGPGEFVAVIGKS